MIIAGKEYGSGSSRDWAAKGTLLLGVRAVIAESFERIHRSNLVQMGVLPLQFLPGESVTIARIDRRRIVRRTGCADGRGFGRRKRTGHRHAAQMASKFLSTFAPASIHHRKASTIAMAAFCPMFCGSW